jgi:DNA-binding NarL/FixJ family response regulator
MPKIKIAIAEDNEIALKSIVHKLSQFDDLKIEFWAQNGLILLEKLGKTPVDFILMDIEMPQMDGIEATQAIQNQFPQVKVVMLTTFDDDDKIFKAILAGASGYLLKDEPAQNIHGFVHGTMRGGAAMSAGVALRAMNYIRSNMSVVNNEEVLLTARELEILGELKNALSYKQVAEKFFISEGTVRKHTENIYKKLQVNNKISAINFASSKKWI